MGGILLFINFSNHPSENWPKEQTDAAKVYGEIRDVPFPVVPAGADEDQIDALATSCVEKILAEINDGQEAAGESADMENESAVMAQGEFTLTFAVVQKLRAQGITVLSACSERSVREKVSEDGKIVKEVRFGFVRFRRYV